MIGMDNKLFVTIITVALVIAGVSTAAFMYDAGDGNTDDEGKYNIIARVNSQGSGFYIGKDVYTNLIDGIPARNGVAFFESDYTVSPSNAAAWDKLVFGTPGTSSIQHTQVAELAKTMGLKFELYTDGMTKVSGTLYYDSGINTAEKAKATTTSIDGGIIWEPQFQLIVGDSSSKFTTLALTNQVFPGHTCCVIAGNTEFMSNNELATEKFLAGYVKAVNDVRVYATNPTAEFLDCVKDNVTGLSNETDIKNALANITYLYDDDEVGLNTGNLDLLEEDIAGLVKSLQEIGALKYNISNPELFAEEFVTQTYLKKAIAGDLENKNCGDIKVAVIGGDIHQIAIHWAIKKNYFDGVTVTTVPQNNGAGVATALQNGEVTFGFLGAPPATITTINFGYISA